MIKSKQKVLIFVFLSAVIIFALPVFNSFFISYKDFNAINLYKADRFIGYVNYIFYNNLKRSLIESKVVVGKDGFLFLGNRFDKVIDKTIGKYKPNSEEINFWTNQLLALQNKYELKGIKFVIVIAPNKHSVYKDYLPNALKGTGFNITDDIVIAAKNKNINILDLREIMRQYKNEDLLYWRTDTHWNEKGAAISYEETINYINNKFEENISVPSYSLIKNTRGGGDLAGFLKIREFIYNDFEDGYDYYFNDNYEICLGDINKESGVLQECIVKNNPIVDINSNPQYTFNSNSENDFNLLWLCDSFGSAPSQLYNSTFKSIWKWHWSHLNGTKLDTFVDQNKPDIVIYQIVERELYNNSIISFN